MSDPADPAAARPPGPARSVRRSLGSIVLGFESIVVFLGALVMLGLGALPAPAALIGGIGLCIALLAAAWLLRCSWGVAVGWALQAVVVASGFVILAMFIIGALFTALWTYCMIVGARIDRTDTNPDKEKTP